jgi:predicted transcriptional regulator
MPTISCKISDQLAAQLAEAARSEKCSKSALLREALQDRLNRSVCAFDLVKHLRGSIKGGRSDVATDPAHMNGFGE